MSEEAVEKEDPEQGAKQDIAVPGEGIETLNAVIRGLFARGSNPANYKELATQIKPPLHETVVSSGLSVAKALGFAEVAKGAGRGAYVLTGPGKQYGRDLSSNNDAGRKSLLRAQILTSPKWKEIVVFLKTNVSQTVNTTDLSANVANRLDTTWQARALEKYGANYASILQAAGLVTYSAGRITPLTISDQEQVADTNSNKVDEGGAGSDAKVQQSLTPQHPPPPSLRPGIQMPITINVNVDAKDADAINNLIRLINAVNGREGPTPAETQHPQD